MCNIILPHIQIHILYNSFIGVTSKKNGSIKLDNVTKKLTVITQVHNCLDTLNIVLILMYNLNMQC